MKFISVKVTFLFLRGKKKRFLSGQGTSILTSVEDLLHNKFNYINKEEMTFVHKSFYEAFTKLFNFNSIPRK